jgi:hypothetical protein
MLRMTPSAMWRRVGPVGTGVTANVSNSLILSTLKMEVTRSSEMSVLTKATRRTSQKTAFFLVTAVKTSNLTNTEKKKKKLLTGI